VPGQRELCGLKALHVVASFAAILVRSASELPLMDIFVAILAFRLRNLEQGVFALHAFGQVAFVASHFRVATFEWVLCRRMIPNGKDRRFPTLDGMAFGAFAAAGAACELALVGVLVAVHAFRKRYRLLEISMRMAIGAADGGMFAQQRKLGF